MALENSTKDEITPIKMLMLPEREEETPEKPLSSQLNANVSRYRYFNFLLELFCYERNIHIIRRTNQTI